MSPSTPQPWVSPSRLVRRRLAAVLLLASVAPSAWGQAGDVGGAIESPRELVRQLGSAQYQRRARATRRLIDMGLEAEPAVRQGLANDDAEIRQRCHRIHETIIAADRSRRLNDFVQHRTAASAIFPCWSLVSSRVGDVPDARSLLAEALREDWVSLEAFHALSTLDPGAATNAARTFGLTVRQLQAAGDQQHASPTLGQIAVPLVMSCAPQLEPTAADRAAFLEILHHLRPSDEASDPWNNSTFRRLVGSFLATSVEPVAAYQACTLALRYNLADAVAPASALLLAENTAPYKLQYAMLTLARFGDEAHRELLYPYLENRDVCFRRSSQSDNGVECQVRDVALAACVYLSGESPEDYGFPAIQRNSYSIFQPNSLGFASDVARESALFKFRETHAVTRR